MRVTPGFSRQNVIDRRLHKSTITILSLALFLWLLTPYACCPPQKPSGLGDVVQMSAESHLANSVMNAQIGTEQSSKTKTPDQSQLPKGTPKSLVDSGVYLPAPTFFEQAQGFVAITTVPGNERPISVNLPTPKHPPRV